MGTAPLYLMGAVPVITFAAFWATILHGFPGVPILQMLLGWGLPVAIPLSALAMPIVIAVEARQQKLRLLWPMLFSLLCSAASFYGLFRMVYAYVETFSNF